MINRKNITTDATIDSEAPVSVASVRSLYTSLLLSNARAKALRTENAQ